jgi:D-citramalate synthase
MKALRKIYESLGTVFPLLTDYEVSIPPGGKTDALVETVIKWSHNGRDFRTRGLDATRLSLPSRQLKRCLNYMQQ